MKKKYKMFASKMRQDLYRKLKLLSAAEGKSIQTLLEEAVIQYLADRRFSEEESMIREKGPRYSISFDISQNKEEKPKE